MLVFVDILSWFVCAQHLQVSINQNCLLIRSFFTRSTFFSIQINMLIMIHSISVSKSLSKIFTLNKINSFYFCEGWKVWRRLAIFIFLASLFFLKDRQGADSRQGIKITKKINISAAFMWEMWSMIIHNICTLVCDDYWWDGFFLERRLQSVYRNVRLLFSTSSYY